MDDAGLYVGEIRFGNRVFRLDCHRPEFLAGIHCHPVPPASHPDILAWHSIHILQRDLSLLPHLVLSFVRFGRRITVDNLHAHCARSFPTAWQAGEVDAGF